MQDRKDRLCIDDVLPEKVHAIARRADLYFFILFPGDSIVLELRSIQRSVAERALSHAGLDRIQRAVFVDHLRDRLRAVAALLLLRNDAVHTAENIVLPLLPGEQLFCRERHPARRHIERRAVVMKQPVIHRAEGIFQYLFRLLRVVRHHVEMPAAGVNEIRPGQRELFKDLIDDVLHHHRQIEGAPAQHAHRALRLHAVDEFLDAGEVSRNKEQRVLLAVFQTARVAEIFIICDPVLLHISKERGRHRGGDLHMVEKGNVTDFPFRRTRRHIGERILQNAEQLISLHLLRRHLFEIRRERLHDPCIFPAARQGPVSDRHIHRKRCIQRLQREIGLSLHPIEDIEYILQCQLGVESESRRPVIPIPPVDACGEIIRFVDDIGEIIRSEMRPAKIPPMVIAHAAHHRFSCLRYAAKRAQKISAKLRVGLSLSAGPDDGFAYIVQERADRHDSHHVCHSHRSLLYRRLL